MNCKHFRRCGACNLYEITYIEAIKLKENILKEILSDFYKNKIKVYDCPQNYHRARGEFRIWHQDNNIFYALSGLEKKSIEIITTCPKMLKPINNIWSDLLKELNKNLILKEKLFGIEFLSGFEAEVLVTLLYHKKLDKAWIKEAKKLEELLDIFIIGRAKKQKVVLNKDYINEKIKVDNEYVYRYYEGGFTQPNPYINQKMISWAKKIAKTITSNQKGDFLELYCGLGNFTIPLSFEFNRVLATEVSKTSIKNALINKELNRAFNIDFVRLSAKETQEALNKKREFNRLKGINIDKFNFIATLVDPPRAGLDSNTLELIKQIDNIIYISCNPQTLKEDLKELTKTHIVKEVALFDQFPYTKHIESGVYLERI